MAFLWFINGGVILTTYKSWDDRPSILDSQEPRSRPETSEKSERHAATGQLGWGRGEIGMSSKMVNFYGLLFKGNH